MKPTSLPKPLLVRKTTRNQFVCRACTSLVWVLLWVGVGSFVDQATGACLSCKVSRATVVTVNAANTAGHLIVEGLEKRNIATLQSMGVSLAKPKITSSEYDQIFVGADVTLTVESAIENLQCDHGRYQLVWLRARVEPDDPDSLHWTIWPEGPSQISCAEPTVITLPSTLFGNTNALYIVNVRYVSELFKGPWSGGRLFSWTNANDLTPQDCRIGTKFA